MEVSASTKSFDYHSSKIHTFSQQGDALVLLEVQAGVKGREGNNKNADCNGNCRDSFPQSSLIVISKILNGLLQIRHLVQHYVPENVVVDPEIGVGEHVPQPGYLSPFNVRPLTPEFVRYVLDRFTDYLQIPNYRVVSSLILLELNL